MQSLPLTLTIGDGKDKQVDLLFEGTRRKLMQITLRNGATLTRHSAPVPITVQCLAGQGTFLAGESDPLAFTPGTLITLEANVPHELHAEPAVSILVTHFRD